MNSAKSSALRLSFFYAAIFFIMGVLLPYWPVWLQSRGLNAQEIGLALAATFLVRVAANPLVGHIVDRRGDRRRPLIFLVIGSFFAYGLFAVTDGFWALLAVTVVSAGFFSSLMPIADNLAIITAIERNLDYGRIRLWGSLAFIAAVAAGGQFLGGRIDLVLWAILALHVIALAGGVWLPDVERPINKPILPPITLLLRSRIFGLFLVATGMLQASHMVYYGFATIHWRAAGLSGTVIGGLWAVGVIAEVVLFAVSNRAVTALGPVGLLIAAGCGGVVRWLTLAMSVDPLVLGVAQTLHAATFGAMHLGAMHFINRGSPTGMSARAQALYSSTTAGLVAGLGMVASGYLYESWFGAAFLFMAAASGVGALACIALARRWDGGAIK